MPLSFHLAVPASTVEAAPAVFTLPFAPMLVKSVEITFPSGCVGLVAARFVYRGGQVWPENAEERFRGDGQTIRFEPNVELIDPPLVLEIEATNSDDTFRHTLYGQIDADYKGGLFDAIVQRLFGVRSDLALPGR